jgi:hypothetical protein
MNERLRDQLRSRVTGLARALPEATARDLNDHSDFRVRGKVFAYFLDDHHGDGITSVCCKTARDENRLWVTTDPSRYYLPAYIGPRGWVGYRLDIRPVDWRQVEALLTDSYRLTAPKRLVTMLPTRKR